MNGEPDQQLRRDGRDVWLEYDDALVAYAGPAY